MSTFRSIRRCLGVTQAEISRALDMTQGNVSFLERGQTVTPEVARKLIAYAATLGVPLSYDHVYGEAGLPPPRICPDAAASPMPALCVAPATNADEQFVDVRTEAQP